MLSAISNSGFTLTGPAGKLGTQCSSSQGVVKAKMAHAGSDNAVPLVWLVTYCVQL